MLTDSVVLHKDYHDTNLIRTLPNHTYIWKVVDNKKYIEHIIVDDPTG